MITIHVYWQNSSSHMSFSEGDLRTGIDRVQGSCRLSSFDNEWTHFLLSIVECSMIINDDPSFPAMVYDRSLTFPFSISFPSSPRPKETQMIPERRFWQLSLKCEVKSDRNVWGIRGPFH